MAYESTAEPIKLGYLFDFKLPDGFPKEAREDLTLPFELVFRQGLDAGMIDRPVEIVYREVEGLPKGTIKSVIDAWHGDLVEQGCLVVFGPYITDNCVPTRKPSKTGSVFPPSAARVRMTGWANGHLPCPKGP